MLSLSAAAIAEKNALGNASPFLVLLEIQLDVDTIRVVQNTENVTWDGETWVAFPFKLSGLDEPVKGEMPRLTLQVGNASRAIQNYIEQDDGGIDRVVILRVVHAEHLDLTDPEIRQDYIVTGTKCDSTWATFTLGAANAFRRRFPQNRCMKNFCRWAKFKGTQCGYSGAATECDRTLSRCKVLLNSERFGGFPGLGRQGFFRVANGNT